MAIKLNPQCGDPLDKCFACVMGSCTVLTYTNGVHYPYNPASSVEHEVMSRKKN